MYERGSPREKQQYPCRQCAGTGFLSRTVGTTGSRKGRRTASVVLYSRGWTIILPFTIGRDLPKHQRIAFPGTVPYGGTGLRFVSFLHTGETAPDGSDPVSGKTETALC